MTERQYVEVRGKRYPLKTKAERTAVQSTNSGNNGRSVNLPNTQLPSSDAARQVLLALSLAILTFLAAGGKIEKVIAKAKGEAPPAIDQPFTAATLFAWGFIFFVLMVMADLRPTRDLAKAFAWLIMLSVLLEFGPEALKNLTNLFNRNQTNIQLPNTATPLTGGGI